MDDDVEKVVVNNFDEDGRGDEVRKVVKMEVEVIITVVRLVGLGYSTS